MLNFVSFKKYIIKNFILEIKGDISYEVQSDIKSYSINVWPFSEIGQWQGYTRFRQSSYRTINCQKTDNFSKCWLG